MSILELNKIILEAKEYCWSTQNDSCYWVYDPYLGPQFTCQYYLALNYLNLLNKSKFDINPLKDIIISTQCDDGGWMQVLDTNRNFSDLDATVFIYWFLKAAKIYPQSHEVLVNARNFILSKGGLVQCSHMTKIWLCLFGQYSWDNIAYIPLFCFREKYLGQSYTYIRPWVAQWVYPHVLPIAYLRYWKKQKFFSENFNISELNSSKEEIIDYTNTPRPTKPPYDIKNLLEKLDEIRRPLGSYGTYSVSTMFSLMAIQDWLENFASKIEHYELSQKITRSIKFLDDCYINIKHYPYMGTVDDGRWWDTLLITLGLLECQEEKEKLIPVIENFLKYGVQPCGGIAYGFDFEYAPDTDDTGVMVIILAKYFKDKYKTEINRANEWLISMQNLDGGFGAFAKENNSWFFIRLFSGDFQNSAEIFDASSVDVTAHILEGWAESGYTLDDLHVKKAIEYIKKQQTSFGAWEGRWGCNYIYSVGAVVTALAKFNIFEEWVCKSVKWLMSCQNDDGGFGESTLSYTDSKWIGKGKSTASQTAWALLALIEFYNSNQINCRDSVQRAVEFLRFNFKDKRWHDQSSVGTGHRKLIYMQYPVYAIAWPMVALAKFKKLTEPKDF